MDTFDFTTAQALAGHVARGEVSAVQLAQRALDRAQATQSTLNAFFDIDAEGALGAARAIDQSIARGEPPGPLAGVPISVKDLIAIGGRPQSMGSRTLEGNIAAADAPAVERIRAAGAVIIGKTTTSEFGCKPVGDSPLTGITRHPWNLDLTPGGSSAGAAASVAAGITPFALGTDGGGSLRIPASLCGAVGFKCTFGRVPVWPTSATPTLAHVGALARTVGDAALLSTVIAGRDARDAFSQSAPPPDLMGALSRGVRGLRIAYSPTLGYAAPQAQVVRTVERALAAFEAAGAIVDTVPTVFEHDPADLWMAEFYAGVGTRLRQDLEQRRERLDPVVADLLDAAMGQSMRDYYEKVFQRYALRETMRRFHERYDLLVTPTLPVTQMDAGQIVPTGYESRNALSWVYYTYPFNLTGQPALSLCAGLGDDAMPVGMQIVGPLWGEEHVVAAAAVIEQRVTTDWRRSVV